MKTPAYFLFLTLTVCSGTAAFAQTRPVLDNFNAAGGVRLAALAVDPPKPSATAGIRLAAARHYIPSPLTGDEYQMSVASRPEIQQEIVLVKTTVQQSPRVVYDDYRQIQPVYYTSAAGNHLKGFSTGDSMIDALIVDSSKRYGIDPLLIYSQMSQESSFKRQAKSNKGASGLMQLMPATARRLGVSDIYDPRQNIDGGVKYMRILMDMFNGDVNLALAGYNAGEGAVVKYGYVIPPYAETQDYVRRISSRYRAITGKPVASREVANAR
ncbi:MAG TPA: lytic transglycosylase domain-containing protein [Pyrinomonadaceae bacterium]|jgi:soluble lytic murein transglycosylase-like protein|nr:lytic transglycosylase domain-containing protein [Pyrinomonadaceae bacterium]